MALDHALEESRAYFSRKLRDHGNVPAGVDWNSDEAQIVRFQQLLRIVDPTRPFSLIDYGCGYGALVSYMQALGWEFTYFGFDLLEPMVQAGRLSYPDAANVRFTTVDASLPVVDYLVAGGIFNLKFSASVEGWRDYTLGVLGAMDKLTTKGFAFNMLTLYSDPERMEARPDAYYGDPLFYFDHCKRRFSRNVALLHDYGLYDFTILVRKQL